MTSASARINPPAGNCSPDCRKMSSKTIYGQPERLALRLHQQSSCDLHVKRRFAGR